MRMQENRKYVRWKLSRPARFRLVGEEQEEEKLALTRDVSFAGAQLSLFENLHLNDKLDMYLEIPDEDDSLRCQGKVVWQKSVTEEGPPHFICGLSFTQLKDKDKDKIFQYVRSCLPGELKEKWWEGVK